MAWAVEGEAERVSHRHVVALQKGAPWQPSLSSLRFVRRRACWHELTGPVSHFLPCLFCTHVVHVQVTGLSAGEKGPRGAAANWESDACARQCQGDCWDHVSPHLGAEGKNLAPRKVCGWLELVGRKHHVVLWL